jgi:hypothetical protein
MAVLLVVIRALPADCSRDRRSQGLPMRARFAGIWQPASGYSLFASGRNSATIVMIVAKSGAT